MHPTAALNFVEEEEEEEEEGRALLRRRHFRRPVMPVNDLWREGREGRGEGEAMMQMGGHGEAMEERVSRFSPLSDSFHAEVFGRVI